MPEPENKDVDNEDKDKLPATFDVKVNGEVKTVTLEELQKNYSLGQGAQTRMQELATLRTEAESDIALAQLLKGMKDDKNPNPGKMRQIANAIGIEFDEAQFTAMLNNQAPGAPAGEPRGASDDDGGGLLQISREDLDPALQAQLDQIVTATEKLTEAEQAKLSAEYRAHIFEGADAGVDKDEFFATIKDEAVLARAKKYVRNEVQRLVGLEKKPWPDVLEEILPDARALFKNVGSQTSGLDGNTFTGIGPASGIPPVLKQTDLVKPVSSMNEGYSKNFRDRLIQRLGKTKAGRQKLREMLASR